MATLGGTVGWDSLRDSRGQPRVSGSPAARAPSAPFPARLAPLIEECRQLSLIFFFKLSFSP